MVPGPQDQVDSLTPRIAAGQCRIERRPAIDVLLVEADPDTMSIGTFGGSFARSLSTACPCQKLS